MRRQHSTNPLLQQKKLFSLLVLDLNPKETFSLPVIDLNSKKI